MCYFYYEEAKEIFGKVSNAYQKLSQSEERLQYD